MCVSVIDMILDRVLPLVKLTATEILMSIVAAFGVGIVALLIFVWATEGSRMDLARHDLQDVRLVIREEIAAARIASESVAERVSTEMVPAGAPSDDGELEAAYTLFKSKGCIGCHMAPGIPEAKGTIGPDLEGLASRGQVAGVLDLNLANLTKWIQNPPAIKPGTVMPALGLSDADVKTLVVWLLTLK